MHNIICIFLLILSSCATKPVVAPDISSQSPTPVEVDDKLLAQAREILRRAPLIDGHNDLPFTLRTKGEGNVEGFDLRAHAPTDTDIPRLRAGGVGGQFWSVFIVAGEEAAKQGFSKTQLEQIDIALRMIQLYPDHFQLALSSSDIKDAMAKGKIASLLGMEGGHAIENSLGALRSFYRLGVRYMTLTHSKNTDWADACTDEEKLGGLSEFGREVVREMNRLGMMVDLSHVSPKTMKDALKVTRAPVIFSHSSARALTDNVRNVPDDVLRLVKKNNGIVMVTFVTSFVSEEVNQWDKREKQPDEEKQAPHATLAQVADHIDHIRKVAGVDHVGIGGDYYDQDSLPIGLEDVSRYPYLFAELLRRGWSEVDLEKLAQRNLLRVFGDVESVAKRLQVTEKPRIGVKL